MNVRNTLFRAFAYIPRAGGLVFLVLLIGGCYSLRHANEDFRNRMFHLSEMDVLQKAIDAFKKNDFQEAKNAFASLHASAKSDSIRRQSLYGLTVTRLMTAKSSTDFDEAYELWRSWAAIAPSDSLFEDPRMLEPILFCRFLTQSLQTDTGYTIEPCAEIPVEPICVDHEVEINNLQSKMAALIAEIETLKKQNRQLELKNREMQALKDKIKALEAIDQNIQKKKTEIAAPQ